MTSTTPLMNYLEQLEKDMVFIEGDTFQMKSENWIYNKKLENVFNVSDFYLCKYPVTQGLWQAVMGSENNPSYFKGLNRPVEGVSWDDTKGFLEKLNKQMGLKYRLPSEAEWGYAARGRRLPLPPGETPPLGVGGQGGTGFIYAGSNKLKEVGWYNSNSRDETKPVGMKLPNELGLYDMSGNVWEWCADVRHKNYGGAWLGGGEQASRVVRGGSWSDNVNICRVSNRGRYISVYRSSYLIGFRLARY